MRYDWIKYSEQLFRHEKEEIIFNIKVRISTQ